MSDIEVQDGGIPIPLEIRVIYGQVYYVPKGTGELSRPVRTSPRYFETSHFVPLQPPTFPIDHQHEVIPKCDYDGCSKNAYYTNGRCRGHHSVKEIEMRPRDRELEQEWRSSMAVFEEKMEKIDYKTLYG